MRPRLASAVVVVASTLACYVASALTGSDPLFVVELIGGLVVAAWATTAVAQVGRSALLARRLSAQADSAWIEGVHCRVLPSQAPRAFVAGALRPSVFVTSGALAVLTTGELRAVVLHETHHARTLAPVRASLVEAWSVATDRLPRAQRALAKRLGAIEIEADRFAMAAGASRRHLASALLKLEPGPVAVGFAGGGDDRLLALLGDEAPRARWVPVEWMAGLVLVGLAAGCRLAGTTVGV